MVKKVVVRGTATYEAMVDDKTKVIFIDRTDEAPSITLGFICEGKWWYQSMMWCCRAGKASYFPAMVQLYRYLRRNKITDHSLRFIAWGDNRLKNSGYAIGTPAHNRHMEISARFDALRRREKAVLAGMKEAVANIPLGPRWLLEYCGNDLWVFNDRPVAANVRTECIHVKVSSDRIYLTREVGSSGPRNTVDPFRYMMGKREDEAVAIYDGEISPDHQVATAIEELQRLMSKRDTEGFAVLQAA